MLSIEQLAIYFINIATFLLLASGISISAWAGWISMSVISLSVWEWLFFVSYVWLLQEIQ